MSSFFASIAAFTPSMPSARSWASARTAKARPTPACIRASGSTPRWLAMGDLPADNRPRSAVGLLLPLPAIAAQHDRRALAESYPERIGDAAVPQAGDPMRIGWPDDAGHAGTPRLARAAFKFLDIAAAKDDADGIGRVSVEAVRVIGRDHLVQIDMPPARAKNVAYPKGWATVHRSAPFIPTHRSGAPLMFGDPWLRNGRRAIEQLGNQRPERAHKGIGILFSREPERLLMVRGVIPLWRPSEMGAALISADEKIGRASRLGPRGFNDPREFVSHCEPPRRQGCSRAPDTSGRTAHVPCRISGRANRAANPAARRADVCGRIDSRPSIGIPVASKSPFSSSPTIASGLGSQPDKHE